MMLDLAMDQGYGGGGGIGFDPLDGQFAFNLERRPRAYEPGTGDVDIETSFGDFPDLLTPRRLRCMHRSVDSKLGLDCCLPCPRGRPRGLRACCGVTGCRGRLLGGHSRGGARRMAGNAQGQAGAAPGMTKRPAPPAVSGRRGAPLNQFPAVRRSEHTGTREQEHDAQTLRRPREGTDRSCPGCGGAHRLQRQRQHYYYRLAACLAVTVAPRERESGHAGTLADGFCRADHVRCPREAGDAARRGSGAGRILGTAAASRPVLRGLLPADQRRQLLPAWRVLQGGRPRDIRYGRGRRADHVRGQRRVEVGAGLAPGTRKRALPPNPQWAQEQGALALLVLPWTCLQLSRIRLQRGDGRQDLLSFRDQRRECGGQRGLRLGELGQLRKERLYRGDDLACLLPRRRGRRGGRDSTCSSSHATKPCIRLRGRRGGDWRRGGRSVRSPSPACRGRRDGGRGRERVHGGVRRLEGGERGGKARHGGVQRGGVHGRVRLLQGGDLRADVRDRGGQVRRHGGHGGLQAGDRGGCRVDVDLLLGKLQT